jgi:hypothetical protein
MTVDGQVVALAIRELRAMLPKTGGLLVPFQRVVEVIRTVVGVDGARLTLAHEDHQPKWVAITDAAMELLEQIQQDLAEGPCLLADAENRVVAVEDLCTASRWDPVAVVDQLHMRGVLRQALTSRIWVEQAKGVLAATRGVTPDQGFQQLRARARSSSRKLADLARVVVQQAQRERVAALVTDDARGRVAEARAQAAEQTLQAARTGLAQRAAALDRAQDDADARERTADQCGHLADERDPAADQRQRAAGRGRLAGDWGW